MIPSRENPSLRTMALRYASLTLLTIYLTSMIVFVFWIGGFSMGRTGMRLDKDTVGVYGVRQLVREKGGFTIIKIDSAGVAAKAGMRVGDKITAVNGVELKDDPTVYDRAIVHGEMLVQVAGNKGEMEVYLNLPVNVVIGIPLLTALVSLFFLSGLLIGWLRPADKTAFDCSIFLLAFAAALCDDFIKYLPQWAWAIAMLYSMITAALVPPMAIRLFSVFPNPSRLGRFLSKWQWTFFLIAGFIAMVDYGGRFAKLYEWQFIRQSRELLDSFYGYLTVVFIVTVCSLGIALYFAQRIETRGRPHSRIKVIELGFLSSLTAILVPVVIYAVIYLFHISIELEGVWIIILILLFFIALSGIPVSFAYAILAKKIFGIKFIIRKGLQHLFLSKGALVIEGAIVFIIVQQIITHGGTTLASSPTSVSAISLGVGILGMLTLNKVNRKVMPAIDRRFFREVLDVRKLLMDLNEQLSELRERDKILQLTASTILKALHPLRVIFLLKGVKNTEFRSVLAVENEERKTQPSRHSELGSESEQSNAKTLKQVQGDGQGGCSLKEDDPIITQIEEKKGWAVIYPEKLDIQKEEDQRLSAVNCELLIAIRGSAGLVGIMALGGKLSEEPFSKEDRDLLSTVARQMGLSLENAELLEVAKREAEQSRDLEIARSVQQNLFPKQLPVVVGWDFAGICKPAKAVGGDYYDIFEAVPGKVVVALGDVSGKGLGASFVMSGVHSTIRTQAKKTFDNPVGIIDELNEYLLGSTSKNIFVTLFLGIIDLESGRMQYVNCGHPPAFIVRKENGEIEKLTRTGLALGMMNTVQFTQGSSTLKAGDSLIVYSDGITEAMNEKDEMYEEERLIQLLTKTRGLDSSRMMEEILKSVSEFIGQAEQSDDVSIIVVRRELERV